MTREEILSKDYSERFDSIRKDQVVTSYYKYGLVESNYKDGKINAIENAKFRIAKYEETGNTEYLADAANFLMFEFKYPKNGAKYDPTDSNDVRVLGTSYKELQIERIDLLLDGKVKRTMSYNS